MERNKKRILAGIMSLLMIFTSVFTSDVMSARAEGDGQTPGTIQVNIEGSGQVTIDFYEEGGSACFSSDGMPPSHVELTASGSVTIPSDEKHGAKSVKISAFGTNNYQCDRMDASGFASSPSKDEVLSQNGATVSISASDTCTLSFVFVQGENNQSETPPAVNVGDIAISLVDASEGSHVKYSFDKNSWETAGSMISKDTIGENTTIYFKMVPNENQQIDGFYGDNGVTNHTWGINAVGASQNYFSIEDLSNGDASITDYNSANRYRAEFRFQNKQGNSGHQDPPGPNTREVTINLIPDLSGYSNESSNFGLNINVRQYDGGDLGGGRNIGFNKADDGTTKTDTVNVPDNATYMTLGAITAGQNVESASYQINGTGDFSSLSNEQIGELVSQAGFAISLGSGESQVNSVTMKVKIVPNNGNQGGNQGGNGTLNGNLSVRMEHTRKAYVSVQNADNSWTAFTELTGTGITLNRNQHIKLKLEMEEGYQVVLVGTSFRYRDKQNREKWAEYFSGSKNSTELAEIASALMSETGYEMTYDPEGASSSAGGQAALSSENSVLEIQYDARIVYAQNPEMNIYFQEKNNQTGEFGVRDTVGGTDTFVEGADWGEIVFQFNQNNWGDQGSPDQLGYGVRNNGTLKIKYVSKFGESNGSTVEIAPRGYDHFTVGGYTDGTTKNVFEYNDYDGLIDEMYIVAGDTADFNLATAVTATTKHDEGDNLYYKSYRVELDPASKYHVLIRKHRSTRASLKWSYNETDRQSDFYVDHGKVYVEEIKRGGTVVLGEISMDQDGNIITNGGIPEYFNNIGNFNTGSATGNDIFVEVGDVVTIRMIPDYGYQIAGAILNGTTLTPNDTKSSFTFTVGGNLHLAGSFTEAQDIINTDGADTVNTANISDGGNATDSGCLSLEVKTNTTYDEDKLNDAKSKAITDESNYSSATTFATLDLKLDQEVSKGNGDYWEENITEFTDDITVNLDLNDPNYIPGDTYVVVREHNGILKKINASFESGCLKVPTNRFSTYTVVKLSANDDDRPNMKLNYDSRENGTVTVSQSGENLSDLGNGYYKYDSGEITFTLNRPNDRVDTETEQYAPYYRVEIPQGEDREPYIAKGTTLNDTFTVRLSDFELEGNPYMEVFVWWSEFDSYGPEDGQSMIMLNMPEGGGHFESNIDPDRIEKLYNSQKWFFAGDRNVNLEIVPDENKKVFQVFIGDECYREGAGEGEHDISELDENGSIIIKNVGPWTYIEAIFVDLPVLSNICLETEGTLDDTMKQRDVSVSSECKIGDITITGTTALKDSDANLVAGTNDYTVVFTSDPDSDGNSFTVEGILQLTVSRNIGQAVITLGTALSFDGNEQTQTISLVKLGNTVLTENTDYTVSGNKGTDVGTYTLTITGKGSYSGTATKDWQISSQSIASAEVTLGVTLTYNGTAQTQSVESVKVGGVTLTETTDYVISNNIQTNAGNYTLTITGAGSYSGTVTKDFSIEKLTLTPSVSGTVSKVYDGTKSISDESSLSIVLSTKIALDDVSATATGYEYDSAIVGTGKVITASGIQLNGTKKENYALSGTTAAAAVGEITKATPTITLNNLNETTQSPTGVKAILSPADASASVKIEYEVVTTPARSEQPCMYAAGHLQDCVSLSGDLVECNCGYTEGHEHDGSCGYVAATEEVKGWTTVRPTVPGTYPVRATLPEASDCLLAVTTPVTGTYTLTAYQAPTPTPEPEQPKEPEKTQEEIAVEKAEAEHQAAVEADLKEAIVLIDATKEETLEELPSAVVAAIEATINAIVAAIPVNVRNDADEKAPVVQTMDVSAMRTEVGFTNAMVKSAELFEKSKCDVGAVYTGGWVFMNSKTAEAWEEVTVDIVWIFEHKGRTYKVTIPKGTDLTSILDKNGFAGPLYIGKVLGTCEVIQ